jgi:hypothetical protein
MATQTRRSYTDEFKQEAVSTVAGEGQLMLDPYARAHAGMLTWDPAVFGYRMESGDDTTFDERDSAFFMPQCVVVDPNFDWQGEPGNHAVPFQQLQQFAPVDPRARHLLAENSAASVRAQLLKLRVERLAVGADAGIAEASFLRLYFGHNLRKA